MFNPKVRQVETILAFSLSNIGLLLSHNLRKENCLVQSASKTIKIPSNSTQGSESKWEKFIHLLSH